MIGYILHLVHEGGKVIVRSARLPHRRRITDPLTLRQTFNLAADLSLPGVKTHARYIEIYNRCDYDETWTFRYEPAGTGLRLVEAIENSNSDQHSIPEQLPWGVLSYACPGHEDEHLLEQNEEELDKIIADLNDESEQKIDRLTYMCEVPVRMPIWRELW